MIDVRRALVASLVCLLFAAPARAGDSAAATAMEEANEHLDKREYEAAISRFNDARRLSPGSSGPYLGLGLAYEALGRCDEAIVSLEEYLRRRPRDPNPAARAALDSCRARKNAPGRLRVESQPPGATVRVDGDGLPVGITPIDLADLAPGTHRVQLSLPGYQPHVAEVRIEANMAALVSASLVPVPVPVEAKPAAPAVPPPAAPTPTPAPVPVEPPRVASVEKAPAAPPSTTLSPVAPPRSAEPAPVPSSGHLVVAGSVPLASVYVNGERVSTSGRAELDLPPGIYGITVEHHGYSAAAGSVTLLAGDRKAFTADLKPLKSHGWSTFAGLFTILAVGGEGGAIAGHVLADRSVAGTADFNTWHDLELYGQVGAGSAAGLAVLGFVLDYVLNRGRVDEGAPAPLVPAGAPR